MIDPPLLSKEPWASLRGWYLANGRHHLPWRLNSTPWGVFVAETMLHRTRAVIVEALYESLMREFPSPGQVVAHREKWIEMTRSAGLGWRIRRFTDACAQLVNRYDGRVPSDANALLSLPGVGHYIMSAVRCFGYAIPAGIVDTNTIRLASRIAGMDLDPAHHRSAEARDVVSRLGEDGAPPVAADNYALLDLAAIICRPIQPKCSQCPLQPDCVTGRAHPIDALRWKT